MTSAPISWTHAGPSGTAPARRLDGSGDFSSLHTFDSEEN